MFCVEKFVLPWRSKFCRGKVSFAVAGVRHCNNEQKDSVLTNFITNPVSVKN